MKIRTVAGTLGCFFLATVCTQAQDQNRPKVVKVANFTNQTGAIPGTTVFTSLADGLFRVSIYMEELSTNAANNSDGAMCPSLVYTGDSGVASQGNAGGGSVGGPACLLISPELNGNDASTVFPFRAKANTPVSFSSSFAGGVIPTQPWSYSAYVVVELITRQ